MFLRRKFQFSGNICHNFAVTSNIDTKTYQMKDSITSIGDAIRCNGADMAVLCLAALYLISARVHGNVVSWTVLSDALPYVLLYAVARLCFFLSYRKMTLLVYATLCVWTIYESVLGLSQLLGITASGHAEFPMTGTFFNPGPFGGLVSIGLAASLAYLCGHKKFISVKIPFRENVSGYLLSGLSVLAVVSGILVLPASMSRAGWLGLAVSMAVLLFRRIPALGWIRAHRIWTLGICVLCAALIAGTFMIKRDSAFGRFHIWEMEARVIASSPLTGVGPGLASGAYGQVQGEYFSDACRPESRIRVAGCPEYAFNEYLKVGMETGVPGLLLSVLIVLLVIKRLITNGSVLGYAMISLAVFACFSYPLSIPSLACLTAVLLASSGFTCSFPKGLTLQSAFIAVLSVAFMLTGPSRELRSDAGKDYLSARQWVGMELYDDAVAELSPLYRQMSHNSGYLYDYGYSLYKSGKYEESLMVLRQGAVISSDPMFHNIIGRCLEAMGDMHGAEKEYMLSHHMVPCRLYPLVLLMDMYISWGRTDDAVAVGEKIMSMPVNERHRPMLRMKMETKEKLSYLRKDSNEE